MSRIYNYDPAGRLAKIDKEFHLAHYAHVGNVPENDTYDLDGNLLQDGLWNYTWDGDGALQRVDGIAERDGRQAESGRVPSGRHDEQNRLLSAELRTDIATSNRHRLEFAYDGQSRRIRKVVKTWNSTTSAWTTDADLRFLYDGWNLLAEYDGLNSNTVVRSHTWSLDLSGTPQGAGGVGGLLWTTVSSTSATYAPGYDANGNIVVYIDLSDGSVAGRRDYGAFGEAVMATGVAAELPFSFSTKYEDSETGALYYGFRYYNPSTGRWLSRDPIKENGGLNLYGMVGNDAVNAVDPFGLDKLELRNGNEVWYVDEGFMGRDRPRCTYHIGTRQTQGGFHFMVFDGPKMRLYRLPEIPYDLAEEIADRWSVADINDFHDQIGAANMQAMRNGGTYRNWEHPADFRWSSEQGAVAVRQAVFNQQGQIASSFANTGVSGVVFIVSIGGTFLRPNPVTAGAAVVSGILTIQGFNSAFRVVDSGRVAAQRYGINLNIQ